jgi:hypothetical protein
MFNLISHSGHCIMLQSSSITFMNFFKLMIFFMIAAA